MYLGNMCFRCLSLVTDGHCTNQLDPQKAERVEHCQQSFSPELGLRTNDIVLFLPNFRAPFRDDPCVVCPTYDSLCSAVTTADKYSD